MKLSRKLGGFTLVEIMIVVAIIALLAAIAVPNFLRARKRTQATRILEDLRIITSAIDQYAIERNKATGDTFIWTDLAGYVKTGTQLYNTLGSDSAVDILGNAYGTSNQIDTVYALTVSPASVAALSDVVPAEYWSPYNP